MIEERKRKKLSKKVLLIAIIFLIIAAGGISSFYIFESHDPIPQSVRTQVNFALFYPGALPQNWKIDKSSFLADPNAKVVSYLLKAPTGNLNITIQPVPTNFDFTSFYTKRLSNTIQFLTPLGQGAIGTTDNQLVGSLVTTSSWVLASPSSSSITQSDIQFVLNHLQSTSP
jgi:hypothetical protein